MLAGSRALDGEAMTQILDGIPGAFVSAERGLQQARDGMMTSLEAFRASR